MNTIQNNAYLDMDLLRFITSGSVDDGKSTLIGRLLYDSKSIFDDQVKDLERVSRNADNSINLAYLTDGLRAEREQGITIDVAYRYFATPKRKFIIADTPGHVEFTRNMVTGASTADLAIILIDARYGVVEQTRRHAFISKLLNLQHVVVCINKMDLLNYSKEVYDDIRKQFEPIASELSDRNIQFIPISALKGDNVVSQSENTPWYTGPSLLSYLENVEINRLGKDESLLFPVQTVIGNNGDTNILGQLNIGKLKLKQAVRIFPQNIESTIEHISLYKTVKNEGHKGESLTIKLKDGEKLSRGNIIVNTKSHLDYTNNLTLDICWFNENAPKLNSTYIIAHVAGEVHGKISSINHRIDFKKNLQRDKNPQTLHLSDIAEIHVTLESPLPIVGYKQNRTLGSVILIDKTTNETVAAGMNQN